VDPQLQHSFSIKLCTPRAEHSGLAIFALLLSKYDVWCWGGGVQILFYKKVVYILKASFRFLQILQSLTIPVFFITVHEVPVCTFQLAKYVLKPKQLFPLTCSLKFMFAPNKPQCQQLTKKSWSVTNTCLWTILVLLWQTTRK